MKDLKFTNVAYALIANSFTPLASIEHAADELSAWLGVKVKPADIASVYEAVMAARISDLVVDCAHAILANNVRTPAELSSITSHPVELVLANWECIRAEAGHLLSMSLEV